MQFDKEAAGRADFIEPKRGRRRAGDRCGKIIKAALRLRPVLSDFRRRQGAAPVCDLIHRASEGIRSAWSEIADRGRSGSGCGNDPAERRAVSQRAVHIERLGSGGGVIGRDHMVFLTVRQPGQRGTSRNAVERHVHLTVGAAGVQPERQCRSAAVAQSQQHACRLRGTWQNIEWCIRTAGEIRHLGGGQRHAEKCKIINVAGEGLAAAGAGIADDCCRAAAGHDISAMRRAEAQGAIHIDGLHAGRAVIARGDVVPVAVLELRQRRTAAHAVEFHVHFLVAAVVEAQ